MMPKQLIAPLTEKQVHEITEVLSAKQQEFLDSFTKRSRKSKWLEVLANKKGIVIEDNMTAEQVVEAIDDWVLLEVLDAGYGNKGFYKCECGAGLRFQYVVHHQSENKTYKLGETCLGNYTHLSSQILRDIKKGFHTINLERDELLIKIVNKEGVINLDKFEGLDISEDILKQTKCKVPLLDKQIAKLESMLYDKWRKEQEDRFVQYDEFDDYFTNEDDIDIDKKMSELNISPKRRVGVVEPVYQEELPAFTYSNLLSNHLEELRKVRAQESQIPLGLIKDWEVIQDIARDAKDGKDFDYGRFKMLLNNIKIPLGIL